MSLFSWSKVDLGDQVTDEDGARYYKRVDAQLRRLCERKPSGKLKVPVSIHEMWAKGGKDRDQLRQMLEQVELDKDPYTCMMIYTFILKKKVLTHDWKTKHL